MHDMESGWNGMRAKEYTARGGEKRKFVLVIDRGDRVRKIASRVQHTLSPHLVR
jgi:hypothetical protein